MKKARAAAVLLVAAITIPAPRAEAGRWSWGVGCNNAGAVTTLTVFRGPADTASMRVTSDRRGKGTVYGQATGGLPAFVDLSINATGTALWLTAYSPTDRLLGTFGFSC